jgi:tRNA(adenine34) deaminase
MPQGKISSAHNSEQDLSNEIILKLMTRAIELAKECGEDVPVASLVYDLDTNEIVGEGKNERVLKMNGTKHAEIVAIENACNTKKAWRLDNCVIFSTVEPCMMCAGAIQQSRIKKVYFGARDEKMGCLVSKIDINSIDFFHSFEFEEGILHKECAQLMKAFFKNKR